MNTSINLKEVFEADAARRHAAGLPLEQAKLIALNQLVRDARNGMLDAAAVIEIVIGEEVAHGRSPEAAKAHAETLMAGKPSDFAKRDFGYEKGRVRVRHSGTSIESAASDHLSHWANTLVTTGRL